MISSGGNPKTARSALDTESVRAVRLMVESIKREGVIVRHCATGTVTIFSVLRYAA